MSRALDPLLADAVRFAEEGGAIALRYFRGGFGAIEAQERPLALEMSNKLGPGRFDPVTAADRAVERHLRARIAAAHPTHGITGEELGSERESAEHRWVLDPIDGTKSFVTGLPAWGVLIGILERGEPRYGVMHHPYTEETFHGDGRETRFVRRGKTLRAKPSSVTRLDEAMLSTTHPALFEDAERATFERLSAQCRMTRFGGDCYAYGLVALGHLDLIVESGLHDHDIQPLIPILEGAGAVVTDWEGRRSPRGGQVVVAATPALHGAALEWLGGRGR